MILLSATLARQNRVEILRAVGAVKLDKARLWKCPTTV